MIDKTYLKPEYKLLKTLSKKPDFYLTGILDCLFIYTSNNAYLGVLSHQQFFEYVQWMEFEGSADDLLQLFESSKWLVKTTLGYVIKDWHEIAPDYIKRKAKRNNKSFPSETLFTCALEKPKSVIIP